VLVAGGQDSGGVSTSAELYNPVNGTWSATGSLNTARYFHTATLLPNGKVLVAGGRDSTFSASSSAELYDPASGTWSATGSLGTARYEHTARLLPNGKVLVAGGSIAPGDGSLSPIASAELYDPASGTWSDTGDLNTARQSHTATLLPNGNVLVAGGYSDDFPLRWDSTELYDPASGTWSGTGDLNTGELREFPTATLLPNGMVLVAGGFGFGGVSSASAELYDPASGSWTTTGSLGTARFWHTATLLPNGNVLVAGGSGDTSAELYDPASGTWTATGSLNTARSDHTATLLPNGNVLVAGGSGDTSAELYLGPPTTPSQALNISTRMQVMTDDQVLIGGFIVTGIDPKKVIVRATGPSLGMHEISGALGDPTLELHKPDGTVVMNDNWKDTQEAEIVASTIPPADDLESAIVATLAPGAYTAIVRGKDNGTGVGLVEAYDLDQAAASQLANISARGFVETGNNVMIGGFILGGGGENGNGNASVVVRALGPSLEVSGALADPTLELHDGNGALIRSNDNWKETQQADIEAAQLAPADDRESAIEATLAPGAYTAIVRGALDTTGVGLVEVYRLP
jgi:WD40 repeat protein